MRKKRFVLLTIIIINFCLNPFVNAYHNEESYVLSETYETKKNNEVPIITSLAGIVIDFDSGRILYRKNAFKRMNIASTTKIMTGILAIENGDLNEMITIGENPPKVGGSSLKLVKGEKIKFEDLLYGLMLKSGNDSAVAVAEHIGGTYDNFIHMMNEKAKSLSLTNTQFKTPHGLDVDGHYSTPFELSKLARYALGNNKFAQIVSTKSYTIPGRHFNNTNELLRMYEWADGVKTGFTNKAGRCLVTSASKNDMKLISVVLNAPNTQTRAQDSMKILENVFDNFKKTILIKKEDVFIKIPVNKGIKDEVTIISSGQIEVPLSNEEKSKVIFGYHLPETIDAPIGKGENVGSLTYYVDGEILGNVNLELAESIEKKTLKDYIINGIKKILSIFK